MVHRNLTPDNAVIGDFGELYVMGWGFAAIVNPEKHDVREEPTRAAVEDRFVGTPGYASPEQIANAADIDRRTDVYALGAILFEILTHRRLHQGASPEELLRSTTLGADARPTARSSALKVPAELEQACVKATALEKAGRYTRVRELAEIVERALEKACRHCSFGEIRPRERHYANGCISRLGSSRGCFQTRHEESFSRSPTALRAQQRTGGARDPEATGRR